MADPANIKGVDKLVAKLRQLAATAKKDADVSVSVGYTQGYGVYVHENLEAHHPVGEAKFLERPMIAMRDELKNTIVTAIRSGKKLGQALMLAGLKLQRASQKRVPVDTGALKGSAFTRLNNSAAGPTGEASPQEAPSTS